MTISRLMPPVDARYAAAIDLVRVWTFRLRTIADMNLLRAGLRDAAYEVGHHLTVLNREKVARDLWLAAFHAGMAQAEAERVVSDSFAAASADAPRPQTALERRISNLRPWGPNNPPPKSPGRPRVRASGGRAR